MLLIRAGMPVRQQQYALVNSAIIQNYCDAVPLLAEAGADLEKVDDGQSALSLACFFGHLETVRYLCSAINNVDIFTNNPNYIGNTAVHWICMSKNPEICRIVLEKNIDVNRVNEKGFIGPHFLVDEQNPETVKIIIKQLIAHGLIIDRKLPRQTTTIIDDFKQAIYRKRFVPLIEWLKGLGAI